MRTLAWRLCTLFALTLPIACQRQNSVELTLVARGLNLETQISALRETATIGAERLQVTVEYMATRAEVAQRQRQGLEATLVARGSPAPGSSTVPTGTPFPLPGTTLPTALAASSASLTPLAPGQAALTNVVMAAYVRNDDCASEPVTSSKRTPTESILSPRRTTSARVPCSQPASSSLAVKCCTNGAQAPPLTATASGSSLTRATCPSSPAAGTPASNSMKSRPVTQSASAYATPTARRHNIRSKHDPHFHH